MERIKHYCLECGEDTLWKRVPLTVKRHGKPIRVVKRRRGETSTVYRSVVCTNKRTWSGIRIECGKEIPFAEFVKSIQDEYTSNGEVAHSKRVKARSAAIQSGESVVRKKAFQTFSAHFYPDGHKLCWPSEVVRGDTFVNCDTFQQAVDMCRLFVLEHSCKLMLHQFGSQYPYEVKA